ncbi:hypothetical protein ACT3R9_13230, partial [Psychrobacter sp. AOP42-A1-21]
ILLYCPPKKLTTSRKAKALDTRSQSGFDSNGHHHIDVSTMFTTESYVHKGYKLCGRIWD